ncbi:MAG TPA: hypothetical protein VFN00_05260 [Arthrobacter sp.]|jgi:hypothetical protein|nr:hypothetical protein [Arthrobacter sp.]
MAQKPRSVVLPVVAAAVFAGLGRMVLQKVLADRAARASNVAGPLDEKTRAWISEVVRTPRQ